MGRRDKKYSKDLHQQAYEKLTAMLSTGVNTSKRQDKFNNDMDNKIYSYATYNTYWKHIKYFIAWEKKNHPEVTTIDKAKKHVNEWLLERSGQLNKNGEPLSAWTIHTEISALSKLFGITKDDPDRFQAPPRRRIDIKRSRTEVAKDKHFSLERNKELTDFCKGTGCRINILRKLEGRDYWSRDRMDAEEKMLMSKTHLTENEKKHLGIIQNALKIFPDQNAFIYHRKDKGGKSRLSPIIGSEKETIIRRMEQTGMNEKVWPRIHSALDCHGLRREYGTAVYRLYARDISTIPYDRINRATGNRYQSEVYICRRDEAGKRLDKEAMRKASQALGHERINVIASNYLKNI